jgi:hypothetical protein
MTDYLIFKSKEPNGPLSWVSSKYPIESMDWRELQKTQLPEIGLNWGQACSSLKRLWKSYSIAGRNNEPRSDIAWKINRLESAMGLEKAQFPELEGMGYDEESGEELTDEELSAQREEQEENGGEWDLNINSDTSEPYTDEWSE